MVIYKDTILIIFLAIGVLAVIGFIIMRERLQKSNTAQQEDKTQLAGKTLSIENY
jgi:hypothetical protein